MTYEDRNNVVSIVVGLFANGYIIMRLLDMNATGQFDGADAVNVWARMVVWIIPIVIVATVVGTILFNIAYAIVTNNESPSFLVDERDKMFDRRGITITVACMGFGFIIAVVGMAIGWSALIGFNIVYFSMAFGSITADVVKFVSYRRGY